MVNESRKAEASAVANPLDFQGGISSVAEHISESGLHCRTSRQLDEMTLVDIRFQLPGRDSSEDDLNWVECRGVVVRCEKKGRDGGEMPYEVVIFFDDISDEDRFLLSRIQPG